MFRRITMGVLVGVLLTTSLGCRSSCGERRGLFGLCSSSPSTSEGFFGGYAQKPVGPACVGEPIPGQLMSFPASSGVPMMPGAQPFSAPLPNELPMPQQGDLIPGQRIPYAPPGAAPAPGPLDGSTTSSPGTPRK